MKVGYRSMEMIKQYIYLNNLGLVEVETTKADTLKNINKAYVNLEINQKKMRKKLKIENPGCTIINVGSCWIIKK